MKMTLREFLEGRKKNTRGKSHKRLLYDRGKITDTGSYQRNRLDAVYG